MLSGKQKKRSKNDNQSITIPGWARARVRILLPVAFPRNNREITGSTRFSSERTVEERYIKAIINRSKYLAEPGPARARVRGFAVCIGLFSLFFLFFSFLLWDKAYSCHTNGTIYSTSSIYLSIYLSERGWEGSMDGLETTDPVQIGLLVVYCYIQTNKRIARARVRVLLLACLLSEKQQRNTRTTK